MPAFTKEILQRKYCLWGKAKFELEQRSEKKLFCKEVSGCSVYFLRFVQKEENQEGDKRIE